MASSPQPNWRCDAQHGDDIIRIFALRHSQSELNHENIFCGWIDAGITKAGKEQAFETEQTIREYCQKQGIDLPGIGFTSRLIRTEQTISILLTGLVGDKSFESHVICDTTGSDARRYIDDCFQRGCIAVLNSWRLNERHYGSWQGRRKPEVLAEKGKDSYMFIRRDYRGRPPPIDLESAMLARDEDAGTSAMNSGVRSFKEPNRDLKYTAELASGDQLPYNESLCDVEQRLRPLLYGTILPCLKEYNTNGLIVGHGSSIRAILKLLQGLAEEEIRDIDIPNGIPLVIELRRDNMQFLTRYYLDPALAEAGAAHVRNQGFT